MKKFFTIGLVAMATTLGFSQEIKYGIKGGLNISTFRIKQNIVDNDLVDGFVERSPSSRLGFQIGGLIEMPISEKLSYQFELLYVQGGTKAKYFNTNKRAWYDYNTGNMMIETYAEGVNEFEIKLHQIQAPFLLKYEVVPNLKLNGGVYLASIIGGAEKDQGEWEAYEEDFADTYKTLDFGLIAGVEYNFPNKLFLDARYNLGLNNISNEKYRGKELIKVFNSGLQLGVGYKF